jgi:hypothetical protein
VVVSNASSRPRLPSLKGNRPSCALKWLISLHEIGEETFDEIRLKNFTEVEACFLTMTWLCGFTLAAEVRSLSLSENVKAIRPVA